MNLHYRKKSNNSKGGANTGNLFADLRLAVPKNISDDQIKKLIDTHSGNKSEIERALENLWLDNQVEEEFQTVSSKSKKSQNQNESSSAHQSSERKGKSIEKSGGKGPNTRGERGERPANAKREDKRSNAAPAPAAATTSTAPSENKTSAANEQPKAGTVNPSTSAPVSKGDAWGAKKSSDQLSFADMLKKQESEEKKKAAAAAAAAAAATTAASNPKPTAATNAEEAGAKGKGKKDRVKKDRESKPRKNVENAASSSSSSSQDVTAGAQILSFAEASAVVERPSVAATSTSRSTLPATQESASSAPIKPVTLPSSITSIEDKREQLDFQFGNFPNQLGSSSTTAAAPAWNIGQDSTDSSRHTADWSNGDLSNSSNAIFQSSVGISNANRPFDSKMTPPPGLDGSQSKQQSQQRQVGQPRKNEGNQQHNNFPRGAVPSIPTPYGYGQPFENPAAYMPMPPYTAGLNSTAPQATTGVAGNTAPTGATAQQQQMFQNMQQQMMYQQMQYPYPYNPYMYAGPRSNNNYMYGNAFSGGYDQSNQFGDSSYSQHSVTGNAGASGSNNAKQNKGTTVTGQQNEYVNHPNMAPGYFQNNDRYPNPQQYAYGGYPMMYGQPNANTGGNAFGQSNQGGGRGSNNNYGNNNPQPYNRF